MSDVKKDLCEAVDTMQEGDAVALVLVGNGGSTNIMSNASATGLQYMIDAMTVKLGYALAEAHGKDKPRNDVEAFCLGAKGVAQSAQDKLAALKAKREGEEGGPKHVVEDVTEGAGASDAKRKRHTH